MALGSHMARLLRFAINHPGWHTYAKNDPTISRALKRLEAHKLIEISRETHQFRLPLPTRYQPETVAKLEADLEGHRSDRS